MFSNQRKTVVQWSSVLSREPMLLDCSREQLNVYLKIRHLNLAIIYSILNLSCRGAMAIEFNLFNFETWMSQLYNYKTAVYEDILMKRY